MSKKISRAFLSSTRKHLFTAVNSLYDRCLCSIVVGFGRDHGSSSVTPLGFGMLPLTSSAYHRLVLPDGAPFELKESPRKGWGAFATRNIRKGDLIVADKPLLVFTKLPELLTLDELLAAFRQLSPHQQEQLMLSCQTGSRDPADLARLYEEEALFIDVLEATENNPAITAFCVVRSRFNHSCLPNASLPNFERVSREEGGLSLYAWRDIASGEEITFCYLNQLAGMCLTRLERQEELQFECGCGVCHLSTDLQRASDMRQRLIRGLLYLARGVDVDDSRAGWLIVDSELRDVAENLRIPESSMFVYVYLAAFVIEEEGLMDDVVLETLSYHLHALNLFSGSSNVGVAWLAAAQDT